MSEKIVQTNGVDICTESFGNPNNPAVLLIMGATASMVWWDEEFCQRLADRGRYVIRYDNRDVGRSIVYEPGNPQYSIDDMVDDAVGVLDTYCIQSAHIVGMSLGGMLAQLIALRYPGRVQTLTLIATTVFGPDNPDLPPIDEKVLAYHANAGEVDWADEATVINYMAGGWRLITGSKHRFDEARTHKLAAKEVRRANNLPSMFNHALLTGGEAYYGKINQIKQPVLIIHGTEDTVLPYAHAEALAIEIPRSELITLEGRGHEIHPADWDIIIDAVIKHSSLP